MAASLGSALIGYALGGPLGAVVANTTLPLLKLTAGMFGGWLDRRARRMNSVIERAISQSKTKEKDILLRIEQDPEWGDHVVTLLQGLFETDPELDSLYAILLSKLFQETKNDEEQRLIVLGASIKGLNRVQLSIMIEMGNRGGKMSADDIAEFLSIPEWELRNAVRDLELRGIITDNDTYPTIWFLRELGQVLLQIRDSVIGYE